MTCCENCGHTVWSHAAGGCDVMQCKCDGPVVTNPNAVDTVPSFYHDDDLYDFGCQDN